MENAAVSWKRFDPSGHWDAIVIGSGLGGLTSAALLAKHAGWRVLVLERHYTPGGFTHVFKRRDYEWDVGLHYIGDVQNPRAGTRLLFEHLTEGRLEWASMGEVYDRIVIGDDAYDYVAGAKPFAEKMKAYFPDDGEAIDRYVQLIREAARTAGPFFATKALPPVIAGTAGRLMKRGFSKWAQRTTKEVLAELTPNTRLQAVLAGQFGDYGLPPAKSSFAMHAVLARHYLWGGSYPVGGSGRIYQAIAPHITKTGGVVAVSADVERILVEKGRAAGVRLADGREVRSKVVISNAGASLTYSKLLPEAFGRREGITEGLRAAGASAAHVCAYVGFRKTDEELGLPRHNLWLYPSDDYDGNVERFLADPGREPLPIVYVSFPSAKDPSFQERYPGRATVELISVVPWEAFERWKDTRWHHRGEAYEQLKQSFADRMLDALERQMPGLRAQIDVLEVSTPLSTRHFTNYERGEIYGLAHTPERFGLPFLEPRTPVKGLYLTGQDLISCGIAGALASGYLTSSVLLGKNLLAKATGRPA